MHLVSENAAGAGIVATAPDAESKQCFLTACPICDSSRLYYAFSVQGYRAVRCNDCNLMLLNPQPSDEQLGAIYNAEYFWGYKQMETLVTEMKRATARRYLREIGHYRGGDNGALLEIGCGYGDLLVEAQALGYRVTGVEVSESAVAYAHARLGERGTIVHGEIENVKIESGDFDVCVLSDVIEHVRDPLILLSTIRRLLKPEGVLFIATPTLDSWSAQLLRENWMEFKPEHLFYFASNNLQHALFRVGFHQIAVQPGRKVLNLDYVARHFERYPVRGFSPLVRLVARLVPRWMREHNLLVVASGMIVLARSTPIPTHRKLSVIVP